jgi:uncharacterized membrane protein YphA (DoxX/SURF4 family)
VLVAFLILLVALSAVLLVSGIAKTRSTDTDEELQALGVPAFLRHRLLLGAHPWVEIGLGVGLLVTTGWVLVSIAAVATLLLGFYAVLITRAVRTGSAHGCNCFGALFDARLTGRTVARNLTLLGIALGALGGANAGWSAPQIVREDPAALAAVLAAVVVGGLVWTIVTTPHAAPTEQPAGDVEGELEDYLRLPIPYGWLETESGTRSTLRELARQKARLLVFLSTGCGSCAVTAKAMKGWVKEFELVDIRPVFHHAPDSVKETYPWLAERALYDAKGETGRVLGLGPVPAAVLLGMDELLAGGPVGGFDAIAGMVEEMRAELAAVIE